LDWLTPAQILFFSIEHAVESKKNEKDTTNAALEIATEIESTKSDVATAAKTEEIVEVEGFKKEEEVEEEEDLLLVLEEDDVLWQLTVDAVENLDMMENNESQLPLRDMQQKPMVYMYIHGICVFVPAWYSNDHYVCMLLSSMSGPRDDFMWNCEQNTSFETFGILRMIRNTLLSPYSYWASTSLLGACCICKMYTIYMHTHKYM